MKKLYLFILFFGMLSANSFGSIDSLKKPNYDTNYIAKYRDRLIIGLFQSARHYDILMEQFITKDTLKGKPSNANYFADANNVSGFSFDYGFLGFSFGYNSVPNYSSAKVGKTTYYSYGLNFSPKGFRIENSIKSYRGFYDKHSPAYDTAFSDTTKYFQNPTMSVFTYKTKAIYIFNKNKFSLNSSYSNTARQLKPSATWLLIGNIYGLKMHSDSSLVPRPIQRFYGTIWDDMNNMNVIGFSAGGGASATMVLWKKIYINFLLGAALEAQHRKYTTISGDGSLSIWQPSFAADWRASLGYNGKKFFIRFSNVIDFNYFYTNAIHITQQYVSGEFSFGYRFKVKTPKFYKKFQATDFYKRI